jgi:hypothetical protein
MQVQSLAGPTSSANFSTPQITTQQPHSPQPPFQPAQSQPQQSIGSSVKHFFKNNKGKLIAGAGIGGAILGALVGADVSGLGDLGGCAGGSEGLVSDGGSGATENLGNTNDGTIYQTGYEPVLAPDNSTAGVQDQMVPTPQDQQVQMTHDMYATNLQNLQFRNDMINSI